ncbi:MAG: NTP transferase domain-containing protein [Solobacterium sp.]|nr:NTP transferase domain-containing protein [Solobacterium sp.]MBQ9823510.1 NTP transferase domain-containing protein [Solobacterium sp.]
MNKKPVLVILAAGLGSRYGGMKQIDGVGNHGEPIIEFSIYDAHEAGFEKVVLIIRREHEAAFRKALTDRISKHMKVEFAFQDMDSLPKGYTVPDGRIKPWGTAHALLACKGVVKAPFAIINADDFYGRDAFRVIYKYLTEEIEDDRYAMVGYLCGNTLTDNGTVTRGVCEQNEEGNLSKIREVQKIIRRHGKPYFQEDGEWKPLNENALVSMNFWGFTPKIFRQVEPLFRKYLDENYENSPMTCEYVIPTAIGELVSEGTCSVKVLSSKDKWFGVTYKEDKPEVVERVQKMKDDGIYPDVLW